MPAAIADASPAALTRAVEDNLFALIGAFRRWPRAMVHEDPTLRWSMTDIPFPLFNSLLAARLEDDEADAAIEAAIARAQAAGVPVLWWTGPQTRPRDLGDRLQAHGFAPIAQLPGMALVLDAVDGDEPLPDGLAIRRVTGDADLAVWGEVAATAFELPPFAGDASRDFMRHADPATMCAYTGWLDGAPVATSAAMLADAVAGIYDVATLPAARRRGIARAMTLAALRDARTNGCAIAILHASDMAAGVYRAMGFREYCRIGQYLWSPGEAAT